MPVWQNKNHQGSFSDLQTSEPYLVGFRFNKGGGGGGEGDKGTHSRQSMFLKGFSEGCQAWESVPGTWDLKDLQSWNMEEGLALVPGEV